MSQMVIAKRYAKALAGLAQQQNQLEQVDTELQDFAESFTQAPTLRESLTDNRLPLQTRTQLLGEVLTQMKVTPLVSTFLRFLLNKRRMELVPDIAKAFADFRQELMGIVQAEVIVAKEPRSKESKDILQQIQDQLSAFTGKTVKINVTVDPSIIGGIVARIGSVMIDGSIRNQLVQVRQSIIRG
jgi:F-type H+-transporting ATPase subunit delta